MNIDEMKAGPEMDRLVAEKVMGWAIGSDGCSVEERHGRLWRGEAWEDDCYIWRPSTNIAHAWEVVEHLRGWWTAVELKSIDECCACLIEDNSGDVNERYVATAEADTAPLAICRAALKATP
jgi:hypothetical protein